MNLRTGALSSGVVACAILVAACSGAATEEDSIGEASSALEGPAKLGKHHFNHALPGTNGRSCATCHVQSEHTTLSPEYVTSLLESDPGDPLFNILDADDPSAATPTYNHLKAGLVRVTLPLADNLDLVDANGNVVTNAERTISVWRGVPSIENVAYTAPYLYDGRAATLETQAVAALHAHSQIAHVPSQAVVHQLAEYERTVFSSHRAEEIAEAIEDGETPQNVQQHFPQGSDERAGQTLFNNICASCHGGATGNQVINPGAHDSTFPVINPDGSISVSTVLANGVALASQLHHDLGSHHQMNIGITLGTSLTVAGFIPDPRGLDFPQYHVRFYKDGTRQQKVMDLPPPMPVFGPSAAPEPFSVDPGRAIITGNIDDWEGFDVPQLRGIAHTAPYFHDGSAADLRAVVDLYSRFILPEVLVVNRPLAYPPEGPGLPPESLTVAEKLQIIAFLNQY